MTFTTTGQLGLQDWFALAPSEPFHRHLEEPFRVTGLILESRYVHGQERLKVYTKSLSGDPWDWGPDTAVYRLPPPSDPVLLGTLQRGDCFAFSPQEFGFYRELRDDDLRHRVLVVRHPDKQQLVDVGDRHSDCSVARYSKERLVYLLKFPLIPEAGCSVCQQPFHPGRPEAKPNGIPSGRCGDHV